MLEVAVRIFLFTLFPLVLAGWIQLIDRSLDSRQKNLETILTLLFGVGVAGSGIMNFIAHFFLSDLVARSIGWEAGSPFQLEIAFANLSIGVLGAIAAQRRDGFLEATVIAATVFSVGATIVHLMDIFASSNLAPGNTIQNVGNILKPALLIWFLSKYRQMQYQADSPLQQTDIENWRAPLLSASGPLAVVISTGYGIGFTLNSIWFYSLLGALFCLGILTAFLSRSPLHDLIWQKKSSAEFALINHPLFQFMS